MTKGAQLEIKDAKGRSRIRNAGKGAEFSRKRQKENGGNFGGTTRGTEGERKFK